jgi:GTP-binding protein
MPYESQETPAEAAIKITNEIKKWSDELANKPRWLILNKIDRILNDEVEEHCNAIIKELSWTGPVFKISALKKQGTRELMYALMDFLDQQRDSRNE